MDTRWRTTAIILFSFVAYGLDSAVFGPSLPDLMHLTNSSISDFGFLIFARQGGYLTGTLGAGFLGKVDKTFCLFVALFWAGTLSVFIPYSRKLWHLVLIGFLAKAGLGIVNVFSNVSALHLWKEDEKVQSTILHLCHAFFSAGALIAPNLARPFLATYHMTENGTKHGCNFQDQMVRDSDDNLKTLFLICGFSFIFSGFLYCLVWCLDSRKFSASKLEKSEDKLTEIEKKFEKILAACIFTFFIFYAASESTFREYVYSFGICRFSLSRDGASLLTSIFWLFFTLFRFLAAIQARYISAKTMIWTSLVGCTISAVILTFTENIPVVYFSVGLLGASLSNCFATGFLYAQSFLKVSSRLASKFIFGGALGSAAIPACAGFVLEASPQFLPVVLLGCFFINIFIMFLIHNRGAVFIKEKKEFEENQELKSNRSDT